MSRLNFSSILKMIECTFSFTQSIARFDRFSEPFRKRRKVSRVTSPFCGQIVSTDSFCTLTGLITYMANKRRTERERCTKKKKEEREKTSAVTCLRRSAPSSPGSGVSRRKCSCLLQRSRKWIVSSHTHTHTTSERHRGNNNHSLLSRLGRRGIDLSNDSFYFCAGWISRGKKGEGERDGKSRKSPTISDEDDDNDKEEKEERGEEEGDEKDIRDSFSDDPRNLRPN